MFPGAFCMAKVSHIPEVTEATIEKWELVLKTWLRVCQPLLCTQKTVFMSWTTQSIAADVVSPQPLSSTPVDFQPTYLIALWEVPRFFYSQFAPWGSRGFMVRPGPIPTPQGHQGSLCDWTLGLVMGSLTGAGGWSCSLLMLAERHPTTVAVCKPPMFPGSVQVKSWGQPQHTNSLSNSFDLAHPP